MALYVLTVAEDMSPPLPGRTGPPRSFGLDKPEEYVADLAERFPGTTPVAGLVVYDPTSVASGIRTYVAHEPVALAHWRHALAQECSAVAVACTESRVGHRAGRLPRARRALHHRSPS
jgi:hypothetical protein